VNDLRFQVSLMKGGQESKVYTFKASMKQTKTKGVSYSVEAIPNPSDTGEKVIRNNGTKKGGAAMIPTNPAMLSPGFLQQILVYDIFEFDQAYIDYWNLNVMAPLWTYPNPAMPYFNPIWDYYYPPFTYQTLPTPGSGGASSLNPSA